MAHSTNAILRSDLESSSTPQVQDVPVKTAILGEAYIKRRSKAGKPDRFVRLIGETGKVLWPLFYRLLTSRTSCLGAIFQSVEPFRRLGNGEIFQL